MITTNLFTNHYKRGHFNVSIFDKRRSECELKTGTETKTVKQVSHSDLFIGALPEALKGAGHMYRSPMYKSGEKFSSWVKKSIKEGESLIGYSLVPGSTPYIVAFIGNEDQATFRAMMFLKESRKYKTLYANVGSIKKGENGNQYTFNFLDKAVSADDVQIIDNTEQEAKPAAPEQAPAVEPSFTLEDVQRLIEAATAPLIARIEALEAQPKELQKPAVEVPQETQPEAPEAVQEIIVDEVKPVEIIQQKPVQAVTDTYTQDEFDLIFYGSNGSISQPEKKYIDGFKPGVEIHTDYVTMIRYQAFNVSGRNQVMHIREHWNASGTKYCFVKATDKFMSIFTSDEHQEESNNRAQQALEQYHASLKAEFADNRPQFKPQQNSRPSFAESINF